MPSNCLFYVATKKLYDLVNSIPENVKNMSDEIITIQTILNTECHTVSSRIEGFQGLVDELGNEIKSFENDLSSVAALEDWIKITTSEISQLKSQTLYLNQCIQNPDKAS